MLGLVFLSVSLELSLSLTNSAEKQEESQSSYRSEYSDGKEPPFPSFIAWGSDIMS